MHVTPSSTESVCPPSAPFDIVVMAASLGGIQAVSSVLSALPVEFPVPIILVQHLSPHSRSHLVEVLAHRSHLPVVWAESGICLQAGHVYVAPPDWHVLVTSAGTLMLTQTPRVQYTRPSANPLFESVAQHYRERAIAVVLTGLGSDGAGGVQAIKAAGGRVLAQSLRTAYAVGMPKAALLTGCVDFALSLHVLAPALVAFVMVQGAAQFFVGARVA